MNKNSSYPPTHHRKNKFAKLKTKKAAFFRANRAREEKKIREYKKKEGE